MSVEKLAREHREQQSTLMDLMTDELGGLWARLFGTRAAKQDDAADLEAILTPLVEQYARASGEVARDFYGRARDEAGAPGRFEVPLIDPPTAEQVGKSASWAINPGRHQVKLTRRSAAEPRGDVDHLPTFIRRTRTPVEADDREPVDLDNIGDKQRDDLVGALPRVARQTGRRTLEQAVRDDPDAVAWARIAGSATPCGFCTLLISRGFVFRSETTASSVGATGEPYHDNCRCDVIPGWRSNRREGAPQETLDAQDIWYRYGAEFAGQDAIRAMERAMDAIRQGRDPDEAVFKGYETRRVVTPREAKRRRAAARRAADRVVIATPDSVGDPRFAIA